MVKEIQSAVAAGVMGTNKFSEEVRRGIQELHQAGGHCPDPPGTGVGAARGVCQRGDVGAGHRRRAYQSGRVPVDRGRAADGPVAEPVQRRHQRADSGVAQVAVTASFVAVTGVSRSSLALIWPGGKQLNHVSP